MQFKLRFTRAFTATLQTLLLVGLMAWATAGQALAQKDKIDWKDDVITVNGAPYAKMVRKSKYLGIYDYSISGFTGPELLYVETERNGDWYYDQALRTNVQHWGYEFNFIGSGSKVIMDFRPVDGLAKTIVENKLILNNAIDPEAERRFIQLYNGYTPMPVQPATPAVVVNVNGGTGTPPAEPAAPAKSKSPVVLEGNTILQDGSTIGKYRDGVTAATYSQKSRVVSIYNASGEKVAEAAAPTENPQEWTLTTMSDGKAINLLYDAPGELENLFKWLADKGYLN
jgi:hypothetical protein